MKERLNKKEMLGYGSASLADSLSYNFIATYFLFFLTTAVGISPAVAGVITVVGAIWDGCINPIVGYFSDHIRTTMGRRRPLIFLASIPLGIVLVLAYTNFSFVPMAIKPYYYGGLLLLFWLSYTSFLVPYLALASSYTTDYDERTTLRFIASLFNMFGNIVVFLLPSLTVDWLQSRGFSLTGAWSTVGGLMGLISFTTIFITVIASKNKDLPCEKTEITARFNLMEIFREYFSLFALKPLLKLIVGSIASLITYSILLANLVYFLTYNMGCSALWQSIFLTVRPVASIFLLPLMARLTAKIDKRGTYILFSGTGIVGLLILRFTGIETYGGVMVYMLMLTLCTATYWALFPSMYLDVGDYDLLKTGKRRQATILSFQGLVEAVASGIGTMLLGLLLQHAGFDGEAAIQTAKAQEWIFNCATLVPSCFLIIAVIAILLYPLTREVHAGIMEQIKSRQEES